MKDIINPQVVGMCETTMENFRDLKLYVLLAVPTYFAAFIPTVTSLENLKRTAV